MNSPTRRVAHSFPRPRLVVLFACSLIFFNLFIAVRPKTAQAPPIKYVPQDFFRYDDWAPANYVAQGRFLENEFGSVQIVAHEGQLVPGPVFFEGSKNLTLIIENEAPPSVAPDELHQFGDSAISLFVRGSDTNCISTDDSVPVEVNRRCLIQVIVDPVLEATHQSVTLVQVDGGDDSILLIDFRLLNGLDLDEMTGG